MTQKHKEKGIWEMNDYSDECLYKDTYIIINMMNDDMRSKISKKFIEFLEHNKDDKFEGSVNSMIPLKEQKLRYELKLMLSLIYINYMCDKDTRNRIMAEDEKNIKEFYTKNIFSNSKDNEESRTISNLENINNTADELKKDEMSLVEYKENFFSKFIKKLKSIFFKIQK